MVLQSVQRRTRERETGGPGDRWAGMGGERMIAEAEGRRRRGRREETRVGDFHGG